MIRCTCLVIFALFTSACSNLGIAARVNPPSIAQYPEGKGSCDEKGGAINLDCFQFPDSDGNQIGPAGSAVLSGRIVAGTVDSGQISGTGVTVKISNATVAVSAPAYDLSVTDQVSRNRLAAILMTRADDICEKDSASIYANEAAVNGLLNILVTALGTAGTIVTGERAKTVLAGASAFTSGSRDHINSAVYKNQVSQAVTAATSAERKRLRDLIEARKTETVATFSVDDMVQSLNEYHQACSFYKGLQLALTSAQEYPKLAAFVNREAASREVQRLKDAIDYVDQLISKAGGDLALTNTLKSTKASQVEAFAIAQARLNGLASGAAAVPKQ